MKPISTEFSDQDGARLVLKCLNPKRVGVTVMMRGDLPSGLRTVQLSEDQVRQLRDFLNQLLGHAAPTQQYQECDIFPKGGGLSID